MCFICFAFGSALILRPFPYKQNKTTKQNKTKQNKTKQNTIKQNTKNMDKHYTIMHNQVIF